MEGGEMAHAERSEFAYTGGVVEVGQRRRAWMLCDTRTVDCDHLRDAVHQGVRAGRDALAEVSES